MTKRNFTKKASHDREDPESPEKEAVPLLPTFDLSLVWHHQSNKASLRAARDMYFKEYSLEQICLRTGVPPSVFYARSKKWYRVKSRLDEKFLVKLRARVVSKDATDLMKKGTHIIGLFFDRLIKRGTEIETKDAKLTSDILANIHRIKQLEEGKPTDITLYEKMTPEEAMQFLQTMQKETAEKHDMSMFAEDSDSDEKLLEDYKNTSGDNSGVH